MDFLIERFIVLGIESQYWMPIVGMALAAYLAYLLIMGGTR
jgi:hypothetical protein